jgi:hypothetical protein
LRPDYQEFAEGFRLASIAVVSAVVMATLVIGLGRALTPERQAVAAPRAEAVLVAVRQVRP